MELAPEHAPERVTRTLHNLGMNLVVVGDPSAPALLEEAAVRARSEPGNRGEELAYALFTLGFCRGLQGDFAGSSALYAESVSICRGAGELWWLSWLRLAEAFAASMLDDPVPHRLAATEALRLARQIPDDHACVNALSQLASRPEGGNGRRAAFLLGVCETYWRDAGGFTLVAEPWASAIARSRERCQAALGEAAYEEEHRRGEAATLDEAVAMVLGDQSSAPPLLSTGESTAAVKLTKREAEIARLVTDGLSNRDIAATLTLSTRTVEAHVQNILTKSGFTRRAQIAAWYGGLTRPSDAPPSPEL